MNRISAKVVADSINPARQRLTTVEIEMPRCILAELNTHRAFTRNSASSRAIPFSKVVERVKNDPFVPSYWTKNQKGMAASEIVTDSSEIAQLRKIWLEGRDRAVETARELNDLGMHKQVVNRVLEPYMYHTVIVTATDWSNFFKQRIAKSAEPHMAYTAMKVYKAMNASYPKTLDYGDWHTPFILPEESHLASDVKLMVSVARCARTSYLNHNGIRDITDDLNLYHRLSEGMHFSPMEHVAQSSRRDDKNFRGWVQYRSMLPNENWTGSLNLNKEDQDWMDLLEWAA